MCAYKFNVDTTAKKNSFIYLFMTVFAFSTPCLAEELKLLVWEGYTPNTHMESFQQYIKSKHGFEVTVSAEYVSKFEDFYNGIRGKSCDVAVIQYDLLKDNAYGFITKGLLLPIAEKNIIHAKNIIPSIYNSPDIREKGKIYSIGVTFGFYGLMYDTDEFTDPPTSWKILWSPKWSKKYSTGNLANFNVLTTALAIGYDKKDIFNLDLLLSDSMLKEKLVSLIVNSAHIWEGVDTAQDLMTLKLTAGYGYSIPELAKKNKHWSITSPEEGSIAWIDGWVITQRASRSEKAKMLAEEWINYTLSPEYQAEVFVRGIAAYPTNLKSKSLLSDDEIKRFHLDNPNYLHENHVVLKALDRRSRKGIEYLWNQAIIESGLESK